MNILLFRIRTLLVVVPAILSIHFVEAGSYAIYMTFVLLALLVIKAEIVFSRATNYLLVIELISFTWLSYTFGGILFLLPFSTLIAAFRTKPTPIIAIAWTVSGFFLLLTGTDGREIEFVTAILILWTTNAGILYAANQFENKHHQVEELYEELALSHEELEGTRRRVLDHFSQIEHYAQAEERNRIAKDIHDDLGHRLIRVKMMSEAAIQLFDSDMKRARSIVEQIRDQLHESMERMRITVRKLIASDEGETRRYALDRIVAESAEELGISISFQVHGMPCPLYPSMELILFKNAQEAITNAVRHGKASAVTVELKFLPDTVALKISNNGALPNEPIEAGLGMRGMRERIALIGGKLEWERSELFSITTTLPLLRE
jgi:two-component system, NarL family, sensor kinase